MSDRQPLTILHVFSGDLWAGAEVMVFHLLNALRQDNNLKVIALTLNEGVLSRKLRDLGIEIHVVPESDNGFPRLLFKAWRLLRRKNIDVIHAHRYKENLLALLLAKAMTVKRLVATIHGLSEMAPDSRTGMRPRIKEWVNYYIAGHFFTDVVAVSQEMQETLVRRHRMPREKVRVIHNGVATPSDGHPARSRRDAREFHIGTVGRLVPVKDLELLLQVANQVVKKAKGVKFSILGEGPLKEDLVRRTKELRLEGSVDFLSARPDPFPYYRTLDLYLNTSLHEGVPLSILEAMACGVPVVAPRVGGIPEVIEHAKEGFLVDERSADAFARSCLELIGNGNLRERMGMQAIEKFLICFSSPRMASSYVDLYRRSYIS